MKDIKMSAVFELPVEASLREFHGYDYIELSCSDGCSVDGCISDLEAIEVAINNHDRLTEENKRLREALTDCVESLNKSGNEVLCHISDISPFVSAGILIKELEELKEQK